jgi:hypothetical protein
MNYGVNSGLALWIFISSAVLNMEAAPAMRGFLGRLLTRAFYKDFPQTLCG